VIKRHNHAPRNYDAVSIFVSQRRREIAIRIALGASRGNHRQIHDLQTMLNAEIQTPLGLTGATADAVYTSPLYWDDCLMNDPKTKGTATSQHLNAKGSAIRSDN